MGISHTPYHHDSNFDVTVISIFTHKGIATAISHIIHFTDKKITPCQTNKLSGIYKITPKHPFLSQLSWFLYSHIYTHYFTCIKTVHGKLLIAFFFLLQHTVTGLLKVHQVRSFLKHLIPDAYHSLMKAPFGTKPQQEQGLCIKKKDMILRLTLVGNRSPWLVHHDMFIILFLS